MSGTQLVTGLDLGGAHLKLAQIENGRCTAVRQVPCRLWEGLDHLDRALALATRGLPPPRSWAVTMTGELVDLFASRAEGVRAILDRLTAQTGAASVHVFAGESGFVGPAAACLRPREVASMNWLASAHWLARSVGEAVLVDIGSTTTDIVPIRAGRVDVAGRQDAERLATGELVYTGLTRTPVMALAGRAPWAGRWCPLTAEHFATTADIWRVLGLLDEAADQHPAADGGAKTAEASARRLARMVGHDLEDASMAGWCGLARFLADRQLQRIEEGLALVLSRTLPGPGVPLLGCGAGEMIVAELARRAGRPHRPAASLVPAADPGLERAVGGCLPAVAVACLLAATSA
jgi:(4-(4-[2-(gamma-L-glutamylamino)ethyl]phenoxymethyl)furan-2-yl)methanamine synthase